MLCILFKFGILGAVWLSLDSSALTLFAFVVPADH